MGGRRFTSKEEAHAAIAALEERAAYLDAHPFVVSLVDEEECREEAKRIRAMLPFLPE